MCYHIDTNQTTNTTTTKGEINMFYFGKDYIKFVFKKTMNFLFKLAVTLFAFASLAFMFYFFN